MIEKRIIDEFIAPYYRDKDIMHNMWHIELVRRKNVYRGENPYYRISQGAIA